MNLAATAADPGGTIARVEFYQGATLLNSDTTAPYAFDWANVPAGSYTLTAKAIDNQGNATTSAPVAITVTAQTALYFIHADHLNTPRALVDAQGRTVWKWDNADPFGNNPPDEDPDADTQRVEFNLRFPEQYADRETRLHYNYFRDYDASIGRYWQSDPIGLMGGFNTYLYVSANPLVEIDYFGLASYWWQAPQWSTPRSHQIPRRERERGPRDPQGGLNVLLDPSMQNAAPCQILCTATVGVVAGTVHVTAHQLAHLVGGAAGTAIATGGWAFAAYDLYKVYRCMERCEEKDYQCTAFSPLPRAFYER